MKKITLGLSAGLFMLGMVILAPTTSAYRGDPLNKGPNYSPERHEAMEKAFESKDYSAWVGLMSGRGRVTQVINESNFAKFAEAHELAEQGKIVEAQKIRQELGLGLHNGARQGRWNGR